MNMHKAHYSIEISLGRCREEEQCLGQVTVGKRKEETREEAAASQAKQRQWMNQHGDEMRKISSRELWAVDVNHIKINH